MNTLIAMDAATGGTRSLEIICCVAGVLLLVVLMVVIAKMIRK
jgi:hypothetical protein